MASVDCLDKLSMLASVSGTEVTAMSMASSHLFCFIRACTASETEAAIQRAQVLPVRCLNEELLPVA